MAKSYLNLETAIGSQKSAQALGAPDKIQKCLITTEVTTTFCISSCTPISYTAFLRPTAVSRLKVSQVFGDARIWECSLKTFNRLFDERYRSGKGLAHVVQEGRLQEFGLLEDQICFADALIEAYVTTGLSIYRDRAEQIVRDLVDQLEDKQGGGFLIVLRMPHHHGLLKFPYKDVKVNASLALVFSDLFYVIQKAEYHDLAKLVLQFAVGRTGPLPVGSAGLAINRFLRYPVHIVVVGARHDPMAKI